MITLLRTIQVWAYGRPRDLRKGYGLWGLIKNELRRDPLSGELLLLINAKRTGCKVFLWDGTGLCIFMKRLERGRFAQLWEATGAALQLTSSELELFIERCTVVGRKPLSPSALTSKDLAVGDRL